MDTPIPFQIVRQKISESGLQKVGSASIREIKRLVDNIEEASGQKFARMEMGIPGLKPPLVAQEAEIEAIKNGVTGVYPEIDGLPALKKEISRFCKLFLDLNVPAIFCAPSVGSMHGSFVTVMVSSRRHPQKNTVLFLDPGFPVHKQMVKMIGLQHRSLDVYDYRGDKLRPKLQEILSEKNCPISTIIFSNPNNPTWICFAEDELRAIGELATKYDIVVVEDLAYFAMDFRQDLSRAGVPPYQPSVSKYTDNYVILISSSKVFSYAGQRIGMLVISPELYKRNFPGLSDYFSSNNFGRSMIYGALYATTSGTAHSAQYALAAILKATNDGHYNFVEATREYGYKAKILKEIFIRNGFNIVYSMDDNRPIADGFYFTLSYPGFSGEELVEELLYYGVSCIALSISGGLRREAIRACVSLIARDAIPELQQRLEAFALHHPQTKR